MPTTPLGAPFTTAAGHARTVAAVQATTATARPAGVLWSVQGDDGRWYNIEPDGGPEGAWVEVPAEETYGTA